MYKDVLKNLKKHPEQHYIIHYSCQSLYDDNEGLSPRITSIAVMHYSTNQEVSFSTHAISEELGFQRDEVLENFDSIEKKLLIDFYKFIRDRRDKFWLHWNMQNITYGFEHLEHRYRKLTKEEPPVILVERRINIDTIFKEKYGDSFALKPRMASLMDLNGGRHRHFLSGLEEVEAFKKQEFIRMHNSTQCKVWFFHQALENCLKGRLKVATKDIIHKIDSLFESRTFRIIIGAAALIGIPGSIFSIYAIAQALG